MVVAMAAASIKEVAREAGVSIGTVSNVLNRPDVARGAEAAAEDSGAMVIVCNSGEDAARERRHLDQLEEQRVLGVLITPIDDGPDSRVEQLIDRGMPVVLVDRGSGHPSRCSVAVDDVLGGRLAGAHLLEQGHRQVAYVGGPFGIRQ